MPGDPSILPPAAGSMMLVLPVPLRRAGNTLLFEEQACNGALRWADNFSHVTIFSPVIPEVYVQSDPTILWRSIDELDSNAVRFTALPWAYGLKDFSLQYRKVKGILSDAINRHDHLQFAIGGLVGDWASVASLLAARRGRNFAIHTDRVEHEVLLEVTRGASPPRRLKAIATAWAMKRYHKRLIKKCSLGLWHGNDCFRAYSPWCRESHLIHDIHLKKAAQITNAALDSKLRDVAEAKALKICYMGRMDPMKAPIDWLRALATARDQGVQLEATWYGDGVLREEVTRLIADLKLQGIVSLPGFVKDREVLMKAVEHSHVTLFTHVTPESPRCLLESLVVGTPIVGYDNPFALDLTQNHGGGSFVPVRDWRALGTRLAELARERSQLATLIAGAATSGRGFNDEAVFRERSDLIKRFA